MDDSKRNSTTNNNPTRVPVDHTVAFKAPCTHFSVPLVKKMLSMTLVKDGKADFIQGVATAMGFWSRGRFNSTLSITRTSGDS